MKKVVRQADQLEREGWLLLDDVRQIRQRAVRFDDFQ